MTMERNISLLQRISIPEACPISWDSMRGDRSMRFCDQCGKHVYNLSAMTTIAAEKVVLEHGQSFCAQIRRTRNGRILTRWEPRNRGHWPRWACRVAAMFMGALSLLIVGCHSNGGLVM